MASDKGDSSVPPIVEYNDDTLRKLFLDKRGNVVDLLMKYYREVTNEKTIFKSLSKPEQALLKDGLESRASKFHIGMKSTQRVSKWFRKNDSPKAEKKFLSEGSIPFYAALFLSPEDEEFGRLIGGEGQKFDITFQHSRNGIHNLHILAQSMITSGLNFKRSVWVDFLKNGYPKQLLDKPVTLEPSGDAGALPIEIAAFYGNDALVLALLSVLYPDCPSGSVSESTHPELAHALLFRAMGLTGMFNNAGAGKIFDVLKEMVSRFGAHIDSEPGRLYILSQIMATTEGPGVEDSQQIVSELLDIWLKRGVQTRFTQLANYEAVVANVVNWSRGFKVNKIPILVNALLTKDRRYYTECMKRISDQAFTKELLQGIVDRIGKSEEKIFLEITEKYACSDDKAMRRRFDLVLLDKYSPEELEAANAILTKPIEP